MKTLQELRLSVEAYLVSQGYSRKSIVGYICTWNKLQRFMEARHEENYTPELGQAFLDELNHGVSREKLSCKEKQRVRHISTLTQMLQFGCILKTCRNVKIYTFEGDNGKPFRDYIDEQSKTKSVLTINSHTRFLHSFYEYLVRIQICVQDLTIPLLMEYLKCLGEEVSSGNIEHAVSCLRGFIRYLCEHNLLRNTTIYLEMWLSVLHAHRVNSPRLPSVYTQEEVEKILSCFDRSTPCGKRDYAMTLLAARYAMRAGDIIAMRFRNLDMENYQLKYTAHKTKEPVTEPLSDEIIDAIEDYVHYARPDVDSPFIFLTAIAPFKPLKNSATVAQVVCKAMHRAGIDISHRRHGAHSLRHSLATNLLKANVTLPVISSILGHTSIESTKTYLRVDINMLRHCALDVSIVTSKFYEKQEK